MNDSGAVDTLEIRLRVNAVKGRGGLWHPYAAITEVEGGMVQKVNVLLSPSDSIGGERDDALVRARAILSMAKMEIKKMAMEVANAAGY